MHMQMPGRSGRSNATAPAAPTQYAPGAPPARRRSSDLGPDVPPGAQGGIYYIIHTYIYIYIIYIYIYIICIYYIIHIYIYIYRRPPPKVFVEKVKYKKFGGSLPCLPLKYKCLPPLYTLLRMTHEPSRDHALEEDWFSLYIHLKT